MYFSTTGTSIQRFDRKKVKKRYVGKKYVKDICFTWSNKVFWAQTFGHFDHTFYTETIFHITRCTVLPVYLVDIIHRKV